MARFWLLSEGMNLRTPTNARPPAVISPFRARPRAAVGRRGTAGPPPAAGWWRRRPAVLWALELVLGLQALAAAATAALAAHTFLTTANIGIFFAALMAVPVALVLLVLPAVTLVLLHRPGSSRQAALPFAAVTQAVFALAACALIHHLPAATIAFWVGISACAAVLAALPAARHWALAPASPPAAGPSAAPVPHTPAGSS